MNKDYLTAIVTGASRGTGVVIAKTLARKGLQLVLVARSMERLNQVRDEITGIGGRAISIPTDITDDEARRALIDTARRELGSIDILVNVAGGTSLQAFHDYQAEDITADIELNLIAPIELTRLVLPHMLSRARGHIVSIASLGGSLGFPLTEVYSAAKDGLIGFTRVLRADYRAKGVSASVVIPATIGDTGSTPRQMEALGLEMPRVGTLFAVSAQDVAEAVVRAVDHDKAQIVVMPGPGSLSKAMLDLFPAIGPALNHALGVTKLIYRGSELLRQRKLDSEELRRQT